MAAVITVGVNSWITKVQADHYFEARYKGDAWATLSADDRNKLIISAHNWIMQQNMFDISPSDTSETVLQAQCECAWFLYKFFDDYEAHRALSESGVRSYRMLDSSENLEKVVFPDFLCKILLDYNSAIKASFPNVKRTLEDNRVT